MTGFADRLRGMIAQDGPIALVEYMALCNAHYYATRDPLGAAGDFTTAPEISQMFGELIGLWCADLWQRGGSPAVAWVELGPGRGTLAADALRAMAKAGLAPPVHLVETSPVLAAAQARAVPGATHHASIETLPTDRPLLIVANEFFDALPVQQIVQQGGTWRERTVVLDGDRLALSLGAEPHDPVALAMLGVAGTMEVSPASTQLVQSLAGRLVLQGGALLAIDYGYEGPRSGDTLQALKGHRFADPLAEPGEQDLTCHVDFAALAHAVRVAGAKVYPLLTQGAFLTALGIGNRAAALAKAAPDRAGEIDAAHRRLVAPDQMGDLFKALAITAPGWPAPAGFA